MDDNFKINLKDLLEATYEMYDKKFSMMVLELWLQVLKNYEFKAIKNAFSLHITNPDKGTFIPKPADIIKIMDGSHQNNSFIAWTKAKKAFSDVGQYEDVVFDDPIIHAVISDMGGWVKLCVTTERELPFIKKEFADRYQAFKASGGVTEYPKLLGGTHNGNNRSKGLLEHISKPVLIGDTSKAQIVYNGGKQKQIATSRLKELI